MQADFAIVRQSRRGDAGPEIDQAIALENVHGRLRMDLRQDSQVRHHKDAVFGQPGNSLGFEGVDQHRGGLFHPRGVGEYAARGDQQVESHVVDDRAVARFLREHVAHRACCCTPRRSTAKLRC